MDKLIINCLASFAISIFIGGIMIPQILLIAFRKKLFDEPDDRKIHTSKVPRLGGIAFTPVVILCLSLMLGFDSLLNNWTFYSSVNENIMPVTWGICAILSIYLVGMADDLVGVRYRAKFLVQIICAVLLIMGGLCVTNYQGFLGINLVPFWIGCLLTVFFFVFVVNSINLIDGIDGLASGLSAIVFALYGLFFIFQQSYLYAVLAFATLGVLVPFYYYNVFGKASEHKKIFMGDTGSLTIGLLIVFLALEILNIPDAKITSEARMLGNPMMVVFAPLLVPCFDVIRVYFHRVRHNSNPFLPDKNHIHHKLLAINFSQRRAMVTIVLISLLGCMFNIFLIRWININLLLLIDVFIWTLWNIFLSRKIQRLNNRC